MDPISELENALGAELLRLKMLGRQPPTIGDRYLVEGVLGRGASGIVLAAVDRRLNRPVAVKARIAQDDAAALAEARTLARLDHPNVVRVHDVDESSTVLDGREFRLWVVSMARVDGRNMRDWLRESKRSPLEVLAVLVDAGRGIAAAHAAGIVHRDVKPDNIIVRPDGAAQVLDFGFAVQASAAESEVAGVGAAGTDVYMAPEARLGRTSKRSDVYSLGVTLVEALSGEPKPAGRRIPSGVSPQVWAIAQRATSPDREDRYSDVSAMVEAMASAARLPTRSRVVPIVVAVGIAGALGAAALTMWSPGVGSTASRDEVPAPSPARPTPALAQADDPRPVPSSVGTSTTEVARRDAQAEADQPFAEPTTPPIEAEPTTPVPSAPTPRRCRYEHASYVFTTRRTSPVDAEVGRYEMGVDQRTGLEVSLRRVLPVRDKFHVLDASYDANCELHIEARAERRRYEFWLHLEGRRVSGRFATTALDGSPGYDGTVRPASP